MCAPMCACGGDTLDPYSCSCHSHWRLPTPRCIVVCAIITHVCVCVCARITHVCVSCLRCEYIWVPCEREARALVRTYRCANHAWSTAPAYALNRGSACHACELLQVGEYRAWGCIPSSKLISAFGGGALYGNWSRVRCQLLVCMCWNWEMSLACRKVLT